VQDAKPPQAGEDQLIWLDESGQVIRHTRVDEFEQAIALERWKEWETHWWVRAAKLMTIVIGGQ